MKTINPNMYPACRRPLLLTGLLQTNNNNISFPQTDSTASFKHQSLGEKGTFINISEDFNRNFCPAPIEGLKRR